MTCTQLCPRLGVTTRGDTRTLAPLHAGLAGIYTHLMDLQAADLLKDTAVLIVGDHGTTMGPFSGATMGDVEHRMPVAFWLTPRRAFSKQDAKHLATNQRRLTTAFDLHRTMWHIGLYPQLPPHPSKEHLDALAPRLFNVHVDHLPGDPENHNVNFELRQPHRYPFSASLLETSLSPARSCADALVPRWWCHCGANTTVLSTGDAAAATVAKLAVAYINGQTDDGERCAVVSVERVELAQRSVVERQRPDYWGIVREGDRER